MGFGVRSAYLQPWCETVAEAQIKAKHVIASWLWREGALQEDEPLSLALL